MLTTTTTESTTSHTSHLWIMYRCLECTKKTVNLVFLFDGSRSMTEEEFEKNKHFIKEIMTNLSGSSIKVGELLQVF